jgi:hypothetical protein
VFDLIFAYSSVRASRPKRQHFLGEVRHSNFGQNTLSRLALFSSVPPGTYRDSTHIRAPPLPLKSFSTHCLLTIILKSDAVKSELFAANGSRDSAVGIAAGYLLDG